MSAKSACLNISRLDSAAGYGMGCRRAKKKAQ